MFGPLHWLSRASLPQWDSHRGVTLKVAGSIPQGGVRTGARAFCFAKEGCMVSILPICLGVVRGGGCLERDDPMDWCLAYGAESIPAPRSGETRRRTYPGRAPGDNLAPVDRGSSLAQQSLPTPAG
jgi:hypothetical protein